MRDSFSNFVCVKRRLAYSNVLLETMQNLLKTILFAFIAFVFIGCDTTPRDARQVARDALENARIQLDSGNKAEALQFFKDAEHYGLLADDTMTVAHARFNIAANLGYYADKEEVVSLLKAAAEGFGDDYVNRADALRELGISINSIGHTIPPRWF